MVLMLAVVSAEKMDGVKVVRLEYSKAAVTVFAWVVLSAASRVCLRAAKWVVQWVEGKVVRRGAR